MLLGGKQRAAVCAVALVIAQEAGLAGQAPGLTLVFGDNVGDPDPAAWAQHPEHLRTARAHLCHSFSSSFPQLRAG